MNVRKLCVATNTQAQIVDMYLFIYFKKNNFGFLRINIIFLWVLIVAFYSHCLWTPHPNPPTRRTTLLYDSEKGVPSGRKVCRALP